MKKKLSRILAGALAVSALVGLTACGGDTTSETGGGTTSSEEPILLRIASSSSTVEFEGEGTTSMGVSCNYFVKEIEERSGGRITAQIFPDGQIASSTQEYIGGLQNGAFDIGILNCGSWGDYTTAFAGLNMPYLYFDYETVYALLDSEIGESWQQKAYEDTQCLPLAWFDIGFRELTCNVPVHTPADIQGMKIRVMPDPIQTATWEALGASVTPVAYSELYTALQQGLVDAQENPPSNIVSSKVYEEQDYMVLTHHNFTATIPAISPITWNKLSDEDKALIQEVMIDAQNAGRAKTAEFADGFIQQVDEDPGIQVITLSEEELQAFQDATRSVWPMVEEQMGTEAFNAMVDFVQNYDGGEAAE